MAAWTPDEISPALWYDASDASTITEASGVVSAWANKGTLSAATLGQSSESLKPVINTASQNGLDTMSFDGVGTTLFVTTPLDLIKNKTNCMYFVVAKSNTASSGTDYIYVIGDNSSSGSNNDMRVGVGYRGTTTHANFQQKRLDAAGGLYYEGTTALGTTCHQWVGICDYGNLSYGMYLDGSTEGPSSGPGSGGATSNTNSFGVRVGIGFALTNPFDGDLAEIIVVEDSTGATLRQTIEGYLAHKWGIEGLLPSGHPYETSPPAAPFSFISVSPSTFENGDTGIVATFDVDIGADLSAARLYLGSTEQTITGRTSDTLSFTCVAGDEIEGPLKLQVSDWEL